MERQLYPRPIVGTEVVIFSIWERQLKVLLVRREDEPHRGRWALPGGFIRVDEEIEDCATRELREQTGVCGINLEQLYTFGRLTRDPRERVISVAYFALIPRDKVLPHPALQSLATEWFVLDALPDLAFDHNEIVAVAYERLGAKLSYSTIAFQAMPEKFTLSELQEVYEIILRVDLDKRNFRKRILASGQMEETCEERRIGQHRPARLFRARNPHSIEVIR